ncbi:MAG: corrinoid protein [Syntrophaceticus sp.]|jgi:methanogenic corrinoid protein MtbC1|nr:corrinoid protein [Syntrophaceticus sp.]MDD3314014.1 corrinoid protein [Syntrophaceticus sp.]MDD4359323.1 corrinoid protein [Syntrophaceticus sp.]MDD4782273.1 corrinoid protein [Syntrophaceticus sp.]
MIKTQQEMLQMLFNAVVNMEDETIGQLAENYIKMGYPAMEGINQGLIPGMKKAGELMEHGVYSIPEILICSMALDKGLSVLRPHLAKEKWEKTSRIVIGVVQGDIHDIGKDLIRVMMELEGYRVYDLGSDVPLEQFINKAKEVQANVIAMSSLMSTPMLGMEKVINMLKEEGLREKISVIVGGAPVSPEFAQRIKADGYAKDIAEALVLMDRLEKNSSPKH